MISLTARYLVAMKSPGTFIHRMSTVRNGDISNVFGENPSQELDVRQFAAMKTVLESALMSKYHDKIELTVTDALVVTLDDLLHGRGVMPQ